MRFQVIALALTLAACAAPSSNVTTSALVAADAATSLAAGDRLTVERRDQTNTPEGMDPTIGLTLRHADGRAQAFQQGNHAETHLRAQAAGGPLAQIMGLFGDETPTLWVATADGNSGAPFLCGPEGPVAIGMYEDADGVVQVVGLKQEIQFETRPDGQTEALPYSPDQVCARLRFRRS